MNRLTPMISRSVFSAGLCVALAGGANAQLASASAASLALGDNYTALARGFNAVNWNPANLGMPGNPLVSFGLAGRGAAGMGPITLGDFAQYGGQNLPQSVMSTWLSRVQQQGYQSLAADGAGSFGLSIGNMAFQLSSTAYE